jgi:hypothetical protein
MLCMFAAIQSAADAKFSALSYQISGLQQQVLATQQMLVQALQRVGGSGSGNGNGFDTVPPGMSFQSMSDNFRE